MRSLGGHWILTLKRMFLERHRGSRSPLSSYLYRFETYLEILVILYIISGSLKFVISHLSGKILY